MQKHIGQPARPTWTPPAFLAAVREHAAFMAEGIRMFGPEAERVVDNIANGRSGMLPVGFPEMLTYTLADLCQNASRLDRVMFERSLVKHDSGVSLLASPFHLADVSRIKPEGVTQAVLLARASFPYVVADVACTYRAPLRFNPTRGRRDGRPRNLARNRKNNRGRNDH